MNCALYEILSVFKECFVEYNDNMVPSNRLHMHGTRTSHSINIWDKLANKSMNWHVWSDVIAVNGNIFIDCPHRTQYKTLLTMTKKEISATTFHGLQTNRTTHYLFQSFFFLSERCFEACFILDSCYYSANV